MSSLRIGIENQLTGVNPDRWRTLADIQVGRHVYESLFEHDRRHVPAPRVARSWTGNDAGDEWTIELRAGSRFHNGRALDAEAVAWNLKHRIAPRLGLSGILESTEVCSATTVLIRLAEPMVSLIDRLAHPHANLVDPDAGYSEVPVGSGPYRVEQVRTGGAALRRNDAHALFAGGVGESINGLSFVPMADGADMWQALIDDRIDVAYECPYDVVRLARPVAQADDITVEVAPSVSVNLLLMNSRCSGGLSLDQRRRVAAAIDRQRLLDEIHLGVGLVPRGPISPLSPLFAADVETATSKRTGIAGEPFTVRLLCDSETTVQWLDAVRAQLDHAGIDCVVEREPVTQRITRLRRGDFDLALVGAVTGSDPDLTLTALLHSEGASNFIGLQDEEVDELLGAARRITAPAARAQLYQRLLRRIDELAPFVCLRHGAALVARQSRIRNLHPFPDHLLRLECARQTPLRRPCAPVASLNPA